MTPFRTGKMASMEPLSRLGKLTASFYRSIATAWMRRFASAAPTSTTDGTLGFKDVLALIALAAGILWFARELIDPQRSGIPIGIDIGNDLAYLGTLRSELLDSGRLLTWWNVAHNGIPLIGHPNTQIFYLPLTLPSLALGTAGGVRAAYVFSFLLAGGGVYFLVRLLGPRPLVAAWAGLMFAISGGLAARIFAGHLQKVLAIPLIPIVILCVLQTGRARTRKAVALWAFAAGLIHGFAFLAGDAYIPLFLLFAVPFMLVLTADPGSSLGATIRLLVAFPGWAAGLATATAGKLLAATTVLAGTVREASPFYHSQHSYWAIVHFALPPYLKVPGLEYFFYGAHRPTWGWWEFTQYLSVAVVLMGTLAVVVVLFRPRIWGPLSSDLPGRREVVALSGLFVVGAFWLANNQWYSPVHWLFAWVPYLDNFKASPRFLMVAAPAVLALAAIGLEVALRSTTFSTRHCEGAPR